MLNKSQTFILVGRSGCGKGTQLELLREYLSLKNKDIQIKQVIMGDIFRAFFEKSDYVRDIAREVSMSQGKFQPDFLTNALLVNDAIDKIDENSIIFFDGYPRTIKQLETIKELFVYTKRENPIIINIEVSRESVKKRMFARGRGDDSEGAIESRLNEYDRTIVPMLELIKKDSFFKYIEVEGEGSVEEIHSNLIKTLEL